MKRENQRWPIPEIIVLILFPIPFTGPDSVQQIYGRMPELLQLGIVFSAAPFVLLSATKLTVRAARAKRKTLTALCALCAVLGLLAMGFATLAVFALGAGPRAFAFAAVGLVIGALLAFARDIWRMSNKKNAAYG